MFDQILILCAGTFALWWSFQDGEIFGFVQRWFSNLNDKIKQPLFDCPVCMHFWWGSFFYWLLFGGSFKQDWREWLITIIAGIGINAIIVKLWPCCDHPVSG